MHVGNIEYRSYVKVRYLRLNRNLGKIDNIEAFSMSGAAARTGDLAKKRNKKIEIHKKGHA